FSLRGIPPAPRGIPQIEIKAIVDSFLILTVTAEDQVSGIKEVLDAVDLTRIHVPPEALEVDKEAPKADEPTPNSHGKLGKIDSANSFHDFFSELFGDPKKKSSDL